MLRTLTDEMNNIRKVACGHYAGPIDMTEDKFVEDLVLDGCFIIELFRKKAYQGSLIKVDENDPVFAMSCLLQFLWHDLILLENQIPWKVLDILFNLTRTIIDEKSLVELAIEFFGTIFSTTVQPPIEPLLPPLGPGKHILDLLRNSLVWNPRILDKINYQEAGSSEMKPMRSATSLQDSGIKFKRSISDTILDIKFNQEEGVLEIPTLLIQENITETLFANLVCLEKLCQNYEGIIISYAVLLNNLMQTTTDVKILHESEVINNRLKHLERVIKIFEDIHGEYYGDITNYYAGLTFEVEKYSRQRIDYYIRRWGAYKRELKNTYFSHPWAAISTIGASVLLVLTFLQTIFSIIQK